MAWVWNRSQAAGTDRLILLAIADAADHDGTNAWPSIATLMRKTRLSERTVRRGLRRLSDLGELRVHQRGGPTYPGNPHPGHRTNRYTVRMRHPDHNDRSTTTDPQGGHDDRADPFGGHPDRPDHQDGHADRSGHRPGPRDRGPTTTNRHQSGGHPDRSSARQPGHRGPQPVLRGSSVKTDVFTEEPPAPNSPSKPPTRSPRPRARPNRLRANQITATHWASVQPRPVLRGGFAALKALVEQFLDAGLSDQQLLWALRHTRAYTADAITYVIRQAVEPPHRRSTTNVAALAALALAAHYPSDDPEADMRP